MNYEIACDFLKSFGAALGGSAALVFSVVYLSKAIVSHFFTKDIENHKIVLQKSLENHKKVLNDSLELHKSSLSLLKDSLIQELSSSLEEKRNIFSVLHEKRIEAIPVVYQKIKISLKLIYDLLGADSLKNPITDDYKRITEASDSVKDIYDYIEVNKIFFNKEFSDKVSDFRSVLDEPIASYLATLTLFENSELKSQQRQNEILNAIIEDKKSKIDDFLEYIEVYFREILGSSER